MSQQAERQVGVLYDGGFRRMEVHVNPIHEGVSVERRHDLVIAIVPDAEITPNLIVVRARKE